MTLEQVFQDKLIKVKDKVTVIGIRLSKMNYLWKSYYLLPTIKKPPTKQLVLKPLNNEPKKFRL